MDQDGRVVLIVMNETDMSKGFNAGDKKRICMVRVTCSFNSYLGIWQYIEIL
ncbi:MAG: hypothetical protein ACYDG2_01975 [Ruminiclostridium sp.]